MEEKMLSVIIPVYNVEAYLERCVTSIISQDYTNLEIILVDDGSPDKSGQMCDQYAENDSRIRVIHKTNGGISSARNAGLTVAKGDYISFVDSDDSIMPNMYATMVRIIEENGLDILECEVRRIKKEKISEPVCNDSLKITSGYDAMIDCLANDRATVWNKVYTKKAIGEVRFPEGRIFEDSATSYLFMANAKKVGFISKAFYCYYYNGNSITQTSFKPKARWDYVLARKEAFEYAKEKNLPCISECQSMYVKALLSCLTSLYAAGTVQDRKLYLDKIQRELKYYQGNPDSYCKLNGKYKMWLRLNGKFDFVHIVSAKLSLLSKQIRANIKI